MNAPVGFSMVRGRVGQHEYAAMKLGACTLIVIADRRAWRERREAKQREAGQ